MDDDILRKIRICLHAPGMLSVATLALSIYAVSPSWADTDTATGSGKVEEIIVTGTRLRSTDAKSANPISVVTAAQIAKTSAQTVEQVLKQIPSADLNQGVSSSSNNGGDGASEAGLRNLGPTRTLILINGQRMVGTDTETASTAVDLNAIPASMIDHIDVLRDGASSVYGADAIGGVINIVTKQHASGVNVYSSVGGSTHDDGGTYSAGSSVGVNFARGNIFLSFDDDHRDPISQSNRNWSKDQFVGTDVEGDGPISSKSQVLTGTIGGTGPTYAFLSGGRLVDISTPDAAAAIPDTVYLAPYGTFYDYSALPDLQGKLDRKQFNMTGHFEVTPDVTAIAEAFYTDRSSEEVLNGEPLSSTITTGLYPGLVIPASNPYNPYGQDIDDANFRTNQIGPRYFQDDVKTYRTRLGLQGDLQEKYDWQLGYAYGQSNATYEEHNAINFYHLGQETGQFACGADVAIGCHEANFFNGPNTLTPADIAYMSYTSLRQSKLEQDYFYGNIGGPLLQLPAGPLKGVIGFERRHEFETDNPDGVTVSGNSDSDASPTRGGYHSISLYAETNIPLLKDKPLVTSLTADASTRYDYYPIFGHALTWKAGLNYQATPDIRLRGSSSIGFRAPDVKELYGGLYQNYPTFNGDPCDTNGGSNPGSPTCVAALTRVGINPATYVSQLDSANNPQLSQIDGGNASLKPETSQQFNIGLVITPRPIPSLSVTVDYYNIHIRNAILDEGLDPNQLVSECYGAAQLASACSAITRQSNTGDIANVYTPNINFGYQNTDGIDIDVQYGIDAQKLHLPLSGHFLFSGGATYLVHDTTENANGQPQEQAGTYNINNGDVEPRWKAVLNIDYSQDAWEFHWDTRYTGGVRNFDNVDELGNNVANGDGDFLGNHASGIFYNDMSGTYAYKILKITLGMDNILDTSPPVIFNDISDANSLSSGAYDFIGRFIYTKVSASF